MNWAMALILTLLAFAGSATAQPVRPAPIGSSANIPYVRVLEYGDWSVTCDNHIHCTAISVSRVLEARIAANDPGDYLRPIIRVERYLQIGEPPHVLVDFSVDGVNPSLGGLSLHVLNDTDRESYGTGYPLTMVAPGLYAVDPEAVQAFIDDSRQSDAAVVTRLDHGIYGHVSTRGMTAALRYIDERQRRVGTMEAMIAKGVLLRSGRVGVPPPPPIRPHRGTPSTLAPSVESAMFRMFCGIAQRQGGASVQSSDLPGNVRIIGISCGTGGYNLERMWLVQHNDGRPEPVDLPHPDVVPGDIEEAILPNSSFDAATGTLTAHHKGRGIGDCGWVREWQWTADGLRMIRARVMPACVGILPDRWLLTYRDDSYLANAR
jgi:hypothetical protein